VATGSAVIQIEAFIEQVVMEGMEGRGWEEARRRAEWSVRFGLTFLPLIRSQDPFSSTWLPFFCGPCGGVFKKTIEFWTRLADKLVSKDSNNLFQESKGHGHQ